MKSRSPGKLVYSTDGGSRCPRCGWPAASCHCATEKGGDEPVPTRVTAKLRIEKKGRAGKTVTVVDGLPRNAAFVEDLAHELKKACGTGGSADEGAIELQGDQREKLRALLERKGFLVRG